METTTYVHSLEEDRIRPVFSSNSIPICLSSSNYYAPFCGTLIFSIIDHSNAENNYDIIIFERDISSENKRLTLSLIKDKPNFSIRFINIEELSKSMTVAVHGHFSIDCCSKLFLLSNLFSEYDKVIATDSDLLFERNIVELYKTDVTGKYMAVTYDVIMKKLVKNNSLSGGKSKESPHIPAGKYITEYLNMSTPDLYYNTGVAVFNLKQCRKDDVFEKAFKLVNTKAYWFLEQDALNEVCGANSVQLDLRWNVLNGIGSLDIAKSLLSPQVYDEYIAAIEDYYVIHFWGGKKPWNNPFLEYSEIFFKYARHTPWYEMILQTMMKSSLNKVKINNALISNSKFVNLQLGCKDIIKPFYTKILNFFFPTQTIRRKLLKGIKDKRIRGVSKYYIKKWIILKTMPIAGVIPGSHVFRYKKTIKQFKDKHKGERCFIVGLGPSLTVEDLEKLRGEVTFSLNGVFNLFSKTDWRPTYYFWQDMAISYGDKIFDEYEVGLKDASLSTSFFPYCERSKRIKKANKDSVIFPIEISWSMFTGNPELLKFSRNCSKEINAAHTSVYSIMQLAVYMGFSEIYLVGTDCDYTQQTRHCYDEDVPDFMQNRNLIAESNNVLSGFVRANEAINKMNGVHVYNATRGGKLEVFQRVDLDEVIKKGE